jgi:hypothetical protein
MEFFQEGLECMRNFQEQLSDFRNSFEKSREEYLATQLKRPQVQVVKPKQQKRAIYGVDIQEVWASEGVTPDKLPPFLNSLLTTLSLKSKFPLLLLISFPSFLPSVIFYIKDSQCLIFFSRFL